MTDCSVTLSANAGVSIQLGDCRLWVDALHTQKVEGFSTVSPELWNRMRTEKAFVPPDLICFTHCHQDHYDRSLTAQAKALWPQATLILPEPEFERQILLQGAEHSMLFRTMTLRFIRLPHEGGTFAAAPHYGLLLSRGDFRILIPGDCAVASPALTERLRGEPIDLALLNFPWIAQRQGRDFIQTVLRPRHLLLYHLPFREDETHRYRAAAQRCLGRLDVPDARLLMEPLQQEWF